MKEDQRIETIVFGGGCFWCTEAVFATLKGVVSVESGYAGGTTDAPTYYTVMRGDTGHAEVIKITYDPSMVLFRDLLTVFFGSHDATQVNGQGNDIGTQYRSLILYTTKEQRDQSLAFIAELSASTTAGDPIVTEVAPFTHFYPAEKEHEAYYANNKNQGYCQIVIAPKLQKVQQEFAALLKHE